MTTRKRFAGDDHSRDAGLPKRGVPVEMDLVDARGTRVRLENGWALTSTFPLRRFSRMSACVVCKVPVVLAPVMLADGQLIHAGCEVEYRRRTTTREVAPAKRRASVRS
jgi:hypothetical protein